MQIDVQPSSNSTISIERQQQIINLINAKLAANPQQGFCFIGSPGSGKTFLMKAIRKAVLQEMAETNKTIDDYICPPITTLGEWQEANLDRVRGNKFAGYFDLMTAKKIKRIAELNNGWEGRRRTIHYFLDEFDSQPTVSEFSSSNLQIFVNAIYDNAPRIREGNEQDFVQLVISMNKSLKEFEESYGLHITRRITEMCVCIDFDRPASVSAVIKPSAQQIASIAARKKLDEELEGLLS